MRRRKLWIAFAILLVAAAIAGVVYLHSRAAPAAARLLPESDGVLYINVRLLRLAHVFSEAPPVSYDPDYEQFVKETGFQFERDLDQAAFALHAPPPTGTGDQGFFERARYSEIFIGHFDVQRAAAYFRKLASGTEDYGGITIYSIPHEGRTVRVAILGLNTVAVSNVPEPTVIHEMVDKYRAAAWPASGPSLVRDHYRQVPLGTVAWALAQLPSKGLLLELGSNFGIPVSSLAGATIISSARYLTALHLRVEALTPSEKDARNLLDTLNTYLALLKTADISAGQGGADPDVKAFFDSLKVEEKGTRVALTATVPQGFIRKALTPPPSPPPSSQPAPPTKPKPPKRKHRK